MDEVVFHFHCEYDNDLIQWQNISWTCLKLKTWFYVEKLFRLIVGSESEWNSISFTSLPTRLALKNIVQNIYCMPSVILILKKINDKVEEHIHFVFLIVCI